MGAPDARAQPFVHGCYVDGGELARFGLLVDQGPLGCNRPRLFDGLKVLLGSRRACCKQGKDEKERSAHRQITGPGASRSIGAVGQISILFLAICRSLGRSDDVRMPLASVISGSAGAPEFGGAAHLAFKISMPELCAPRFAGGRSNEFPGYCHDLDFGVGLARL
jgi:hypothetical protein